MFRSPPQRGFFFNKKKLILADANSYKRSQSLKNFYHDAGQFYWGTSRTGLMKIFYLIITHQ